MTAVLLNVVEEGAGRPIVLLHPVGLDTRCWDGAAPKLAAKHRVIRMDLRGHGRSRSAPLASGLDEFTADVALTLEKMRVPPVAVVGVSFGGMVATALAISHPRLVSALVASACPSAIPEPARETLRARGTDAEKNGMASVLEETLTRWFSAPFLEGAEVESYRERLLSDDPRCWSAGWNAIAGMDLTERLSEIHVPALCIHAEKDRATPLEAMAMTASRIPDCALTIIEDAPHMVHVEMPHRFAQTVLDFLGRNRPAADVPTV